MICAKCGAHIEEGTQYCTACGEPSENGGVEDVSTNTVEPNSSGTAADHQPRRSKARVIAAAVVVVAVLALGGMMLGANLVVDGDSSSSPAPSAQSANSANSASSATAAQSGSSASSGDSSAAVGAENRSSAATEEESKASRRSFNIGSIGIERAMPVGATKPYDLSNSAKYKQINLFLSNFSEAQWSTEGRNVLYISDEEMATFAVRHVGINSRNQCEFAPNGKGWDILSGSKVSNQNLLFNVRIKADRIAELCRRYFARNINFDALTVNRRPGWVVYQDGYVYYGVTNGTGYANGVSLAKYAEVAADGTIWVEFDVYGMFYDSSDESLYSCRPSELMRRLNVDGPHHTGVAVVRKGENNQYTNGLVLVASQMWKTGW